MNILKWFNKKEKTVDISGLPPVILQLNDTTEYGPNCWNATIKYFDPNEPTQFVSCGDMALWLDRNTEEDIYKLQATGSILALYDENSLIHTAVYVSPGILWHKRGCSGPYEFITEKQLRLVYPEAIHYDYRIVNKTVK